MPGARRRAFLSVLLIVIFASCTKTVRVVQPLDYATALADSTRTFEIHMRDGSEFVSKHATMEGDTVLVVTKGYQVHTDPWRQKELATVPFTVPTRDIRSVSQVELDQDRSLAIVLIGLGALLVVAVTIGWATGLGGP